MLGEFRGREERLQAIEDHYHFAQARFLVVILIVMVMSLAGNVIMAKWTPSVRDVPQRSLIELCRIYCVSYLPAMDEGECR